MRAIATKDFYKKLNAGEPAKPFPSAYLTKEMFERALSGEGGRITYHLEYDKACMQDFMCVLISPNFDLLDFLVPIHRLNAKKRPFWQAL